MRVIRWALCSLTAHAIQPSRPCPTATEGNGHWLHPHAECWCGCLLCLRRCHLTPDAAAGKR